MTRFRPCIDLHAGQVKQIVGGTLDSSSTALQTNHVSQHPPEYFARLYRDNELEGAHVIMLGGGNDVAAKEALKAWPGGLQVGGGINDKNAKGWIDAGAEKVNISYLDMSCVVVVLRILINHVNRLFGLNFEKLTWTLHDRLSSHLISSQMATSARRD